MQTDEKDTLFHGGSDPYLDRHGEDLAKGAGTLFLASAGTQIGPGHFGLLAEDGVERFSCHYEADLVKDGRSFLEIRPLLWSADGWPVPGENVLDGTYQIRSQQTGTVLQAPGGSANSRLVQTARYLIRDNQKWTVTACGGGLFKIASGVQGSALTLEEQRAGAAGGAAAMARFSGAENQLWKIDQLGDGSYRIASKSGRLTLTVLARTKPGNDVGAQAFTGQDTQRWVLAAP